MYDLINWQLTAEGEVEYVTVGKFDETTYNKLEIDEEAILWTGKTKKVSANMYSNLCHSTFFLFVYTCLLLLNSNHVL